MEFDCMYKRYKIRIYPNKQQEELIQKTFGCCRFVYNYYLDKRIKMWEENKITFNYYKCAKDLTKLKKEYEWLYEVDNKSLQNSLRDLELAFKKFFIEHIGYPRFKSKRVHYKSFRTNYTNNNIVINNNYLKLPKLGFVKFRDKYDIQGRILNVSIIQVPSGKYYASICCTEVEINQFPKTNTQIGIDLGIKDFAITSNGIKYSNPKYLDQSLNKLKRLQKELSRKTRGSSNWNKTRIKLARQYEKVSNQRNDFLQKLTTNLLKNNDIICIESLNIGEIMQNNNSIMKRNISDVSWGKFIKQLQCKADWNNKTIIKVDRYFASSQICSCCGAKSSIPNNLSVREWKCPNCNTGLDRDINAAINILNEGLKQIY